METSNGKKGGNLKGKPHYDEKGKPVGGIQAVVTDGKKKRPVELEDGEAIINKEAVKEHWAELSRINQSAGNGVPIHNPNEIDKYDEDPEEYKDGGNVISFNPNHIPQRKLVKYVESIKKKHPEIWSLGGNIFGNEAFENLKRVSDRGRWLDSEKWMYIKWRSYVARHKHDFRIEGVVAMLKWVDKVDKGLPYMKQLVAEKIKSGAKPKVMETGGLLKTDFHELDNPELAKALLTIWNDFKSHTAKYVGVFKENYVIDSSRKSFIIIGSSKFGVEDKIWIKSFIEPYFDKRQKPDIAKLLDNYRIEDNRIFIGIKPNVKFNFGGSVNFEDKLFDELENHDAPSFKKGGPIELKNAYEDFLLANGFEKAYERKKDKFTEYRKGPWYCWIDLGTKEVEIGKYERDIPYKDGPTKGILESNAPQYKQDRYSASLSDFKKFLIDNYIIDGQVSNDVKFTQMQQTMANINPIRELGTGSKVYFETPKYRLNEYSNKGDFMLNVGMLDSEGVYNFKFDNLEEAIYVAEYLAKAHPNGIPEALLIEKVVEGLKSNFQTTQFKKQQEATIDTNVSSYKNPYLINRAVEKLLDLKGPEQSAYTPDEINFISFYSGYGGLQKFGKLSQEELQGIFYEFFTPDEVVKKMWGLAYKYGYGTVGDKSVFEPSVGVGAFLKYVPKDVPVAANEINKYSAMICRILYPEANITLMRFEKNFIKNNLSIKGKTDALKKYSLVIGNPPYGELKGGIYITMGEDSYTKADNWVEYFISRGLDIVQSGGLLIYIVGAEQYNGGTVFLDDELTDAKKAIFEKAELVDAYRLPNKIFERTGVSSEILVFKKR